MQKAGAVFDIDKFRWLSADTIRRMGIDELAGEVAPFVVKAGHMTDAEILERKDWFQRLVAGEQERIELFSEFPGRVASFFEADDAVTYGDKAEKGARKHDARVEILGQFAEWLKARPEEEATVRADAAKAWVKDQGLKFPALFQPLRCACLLYTSPSPRDS